MAARHLKEKAGACRRACRRAGCPAGGWGRRLKCWALLAAVIAVDALIEARAAARAAYLWALGLATVRADPFNRARAPIRYRAGPAPATVCLAGGATARELRLAAHFWRDAPEKTAPALAALAARHGLPGGCLSVWGTVEARPWPRGEAFRGFFRMKIDLPAGRVRVEAPWRAPPAEAGPILLGMLDLEQLLPPPRGGTAPEFDQGQTGW